MDATPNLKISVQSQAFAQARSTYGQPRPNTSATSPTDAHDESASLSFRAARTSDHVELSSASPAAGPVPTSLPTKPAGGRSLVAAKVPGGVEFDTPSPIVTRVNATTTSPAASAINPAGVYSMYRVPGEKNAAATAVSVGRSLDVQG